MSSSGWQRNENGSVTWTGGGFRVGIDDAPWNGNGSGRLVDLKIERSTDDETEPTFATLRELLENRSHLDLPVEVAHRFAYEARAIVVCAEDKLGKSTKIATAASAVTRGRPFLGRPTFRGRVLWVGLEENVSDAVARFHELDADPNYIELAIARPITLLSKIRERLRRQNFVWVVVDSITEYARLTTKGAPPSEGDSSGWSIVARPLVEIAHDTGTAVTVLHHVRRDGQERGSTELFAAMDAVWIMSGPRSGEDQRTRHFRGRGRRGIDTAEFTTRWDGGTYELISGPTLSLDARVLIQIEAKPGLSGNELRGLVGGRGADVTAAIKGLEDRRAIRNIGTEKRAAFVPANYTAEDSK
jgi:hypothetical protein